MALRPYSKPYASSSDKVSHLRDLGLVIPRPNVAAKKIDIIGYDRLRIYCEARRQAALPGRPFVSGTTYQHIIALYEFDVKLRSICFDACGNFEVLFRNAMSEVLAKNFGPHPYENLRVYKSSDDNLTALRTLCEIYIKSRDPRARHYKQNYFPPALPPIWLFKELMTFGQASSFFKLLANSVQKEVAGQFGIDNELVFMSWVEAVVQLRNVCAHHSRLFNHSFQKQPQTYRSVGLPTAPPQKLKALLECLDHMLSARGVSSLMVAKVAAMIGRVQEVSPSEVGY